MILRVLSVSAALFAPAAADALECRQVIRSTYVETRHPNGAVTMERLEAGPMFLATCMPEGGRIWCYVTETGRTVFTMRRFLEADRMAAMHSAVVDFDACLAN